MADAIPDNTVPCILVHLVERVAVGGKFAKTRADWPLHITLVPWFYVEKARLPALNTALRAYARETPAFVTEVGEERFFGPNQDIGVNVIANQLPLQALHRDLKQLVEAMSVGFKPGASPASGVERFYDAHITHHNVDGDIHRRFEGDQQPVNDVTLLTFSTTPGESVPTCEVLQHFELAGGSSDSGDKQ